MKCEPQISVIVPVYNRAELVCRALDSIAAAAGAADVAVQLIVVDNGSTDASADIVAGWARRQCLERLEVITAVEPRRGAAAARACGASLAAAPLLSFFDSDDVMSEGALAAYCAAFAAVPEAQIVAGRCGIMRIDGSRSVFGHRRGSEIVNHIHHCTLRTIAYAVRSSFYFASGGWDTSLGMWDDWELGVRLLLSSPRVVHVPADVAFIHAQAESITGSCYASRRFEQYDAAVSAARRAITASERGDIARLAALMHYRRMMIASLYAREARVLPDSAFATGEVAYGSRAELAAAARGVAADVMRDVATDAELRRRWLLKLLLPLSRRWTAAGLRGAASWFTPLV